MRHGSHGRLTRRYPFPADPQWVERQLGRILYGVTFDATLLGQFDVRKWMRDRRTMMGLLSRHFRIPPSYWEDVPLTEMFEWFQDMIALAHEEAPSLDLSDR